jgi:hypothetical protein
MTQRRSAEQWAGLIRQLERSGQTVKAFASARGIRPDTLKWWQWRLRREARLRTKKSEPTRVKLLAIAPDEPSHEGATQTPVWEVVAPTGHVLRVYGRDGSDTLETALAAVTGNERP